MWDINWHFHDWGCAIPIWTMHMQSHWLHVQWRDECKSFATLSLKPASNESLTMQQALPNTETQFIHLLYHYLSCFGLELNSSETEIDGVLGLTKTCMDIWWRCNLIRKIWWIGTFCYESRSYTFYKYERADIMVRNHLFGDILTRRKTWMSPVTW